MGLLFIETDSKKNGGIGTDLKEGEKRKARAKMENYKDCGEQFSQQKKKKNR